jgi:DMSO/TMAO reductase YedYZ molybdopterin-dependent catalytic subunit
MNQQRAIPRRTILKGGTAAGVGGLATLEVSGPPQAFADDGDPGVVIPWADQPAPIPDQAKDVAGRLLVWESLSSRLIPNDKFFTVKHYKLPKISPTTWRLDVTGLARRPRNLSLADLEALPRRTVEFTLECSGNTSSPFFIGGIGNAEWTGAPLRQVLRQAQPTDRAIEVVFWGTDSGEVTIRDNVGITGGGATGSVEPDANGNLDLTITERFARSMSLDDAMSPDNLLCYEMNGAALPAEHGRPVRLIAPGWYGVANVKWLKRIELLDTRFQGRFMARDYVSIREGRRGDETTWTFTSVTHDRLKSAPAKVTRHGRRHTITGVAWGAPVSGVEVQVDEGPWRAARLHRRLGHGGSASRRGYAWRFWTLDWGTPPSGEHTVRSRAFDEDGNVQPAPSDPFLTSRRTFWENNGQITRRVRIN